jgi:hypothetical protein
MWIVAVLGMLVALPAGAEPMGTALTYQGRLEDAGAPVNDPAMPMSFNLYDAATGGNLVAGPRNGSFEVIEGVFTAELDFGAAAFDGEARWLEISVDGTVLTPRQKVTAAPFASQTRGLFVDGSKNVGIGTTHPGAPFEVRGGAGPTSILLFPGKLFFGATANAVTLDIPGVTGTLGVWDNLQVYDNLITNARLGIGTSNPAAKLHIAGQAGVDGIMFPDGTIQTTAAGAGAGQMERLVLTGGANAYGALAWGDNRDGQAMSQGEALTAVAMGGAYSLGLRPDGSILAWGGDANVVAHVPQDGPFVAIAAGPGHALALRANGSVAGWGDNWDGQLNLPPGTYTAISAGAGFSIAIRSDGTLVGVGQNWDGSTDVPEGNFVAIDCGWTHTVALRADGTLAAWGYNWFGQCDVPEGTYVAVGGGNGHSLALRPDGTLVGWGDNSAGQIDVPAGTYTEISAGEFHNLAIRTNGTLVAWGDGQDGALNVPAGTFSAVAAGNSNCLAIPSAPPGPPALRLNNDSAFKPGTNTWTISSDERLKKNIQTLQNSLEKMVALHGVTFEWRDPASQGGRTGTEMGLIAQEVEKVFPQWVGRDARGYRTLTIGGFEGLTAEAIRELRVEKDRQIAAQEERIDMLVEENARLLERLDRIEAGMGNAN